MDNDTKKVLGELENQGFSVRITRRGHAFVTRNGRPVTTFSGSASDARAFANALSACRRAGFQRKRGGK